MLIYITTDIGNSPHILVDTHLHILFAKTGDISVGGMFLMTFAMAPFSSRRV
jgi:hypothetical protein